MELRYGCACFRVLSWANKYQVDAWTVAMHDSPFSECGKLTYPWRVTSRTFGLTIIIQNERAVLDNSISAARYSEY